MSIIQTGLLRKLYELARDEVGYKSSEFWQHYLRHTFHDTQTYSVTCEVAPGSSRGRVDIVVKRYDENHHTLSALLWVDCKRPSGDVREAELQALDSAVRCIEANNLRWIFTVTTVGVAFRMWSVRRNENRLIPHHGDARNAELAQYIDADSEWAWLLPEFIGMIQRDVPPRDASALQSQSLGLVEPTQLPQWGAGYEFFYGEPSSSMDASGSGGHIVQVHVHKISHYFKQDEFLFKNAKGKLKMTTRGDWQDIEYHGNKVSVFYGKKTTYISNVRIK